jgi:hypothetical protein
MAGQTITTLKSYFETGDTPTEAQFIDLFDSLGFDSLGAFSETLITLDVNGSFSPKTLTGDLSITFAESGHIEGRNKWVKIISDGTDTVTLVKPSSYTLLIPSSFTNGGTLSAGTYTMAFAFIDGEIQMKYEEVGAVAAPWTNFNGTTTYLDFDDILDSVLTSDSDIMELEFEGRNMVLGGRFWCKGATADSSMAYETYITAAAEKLLHNYDSSGDATVSLRYVTDAIVDYTNAAKWTFKKDGTTLTILKDDVLVASSLDAAPGSWTGGIFNSTSHLVFGCIKNASDVTSVFIEGDFRNLKVTINSTVYINVPNCSTGTDISGQGNNGVFTA